MSPAEREPVSTPTIEEWTLERLGYAHCLDQELFIGGNPVVARNFLACYGNSPHRQNTEDLLEGFRMMDPSDADYEATKQYIGGYLKTILGEPRFDQATS
jgi:hypothetical protein